LIFLAGSSFAQVGKWAPSAVRLGGDPGTFYYMIFSERRGFFEFEADVDFNRFFLVANYGLSDYRLEKPTFLYTNSGSYMRFGVDINFMHDNPNNNVAFFGLRYATNSFKDQLEYDTEQIIQSEIGWPNSTETMSNDRVRANWFEMNAGLKIRVVKQLYFGFTLRYKLLMDPSGFSRLRPYYIPGFGKNATTSAFGFNYYISYRLPFRKKTVYLDKYKEVLDQNQSETSGN
jgi:hypothetical protein